MHHQLCVANSLLEYNKKWKGETFILVLHFMNLTLSSHRHPRYHICTVNWNRLAAFEKMALSSASIETKPFIFHSFWTNYFTFLKSLRKIIRHSYYSACSLLKAVWFLTLNLCNQAQNVLVNEKLPFAFLFFLAKVQVPTCSFRDYTQHTTHECKIWDTV